MRRAETDTVQVKLRMKETLRARLDALAEQRGVSLGAEIVTRLDRSIWHDQVLGTPEMARLSLTMTASFVGATQGEDWAADPVPYSHGVAAVLDALIRGMPSGPDRSLSISNIVGRLMSLLARAPEDVK